MSLSDPIVIHCPACGGRLRAARTAIGSLVGCPTCQASLTVKDPADSAPVPLITDPSRKLGVSPRSGNQLVADSGFKDRLRRTSEPTLQVDPDNPSMKRRDWRKEKHADTLTEWDHQPRRHTRRRHTQRLILIGSVLAALLALILGSFFWQRLRHPKANFFPSANIARPLELQATADFRDQVWLVVQQFCASPNPTAFLPLIRDPLRVEPLLKRFYTSEDPWIPLALASRPDLSALEVHRNFVIFKLPLSDFDTRPIALEQTPDGFRIDWESFVGYSDLTWVALRRTRPRQPTLLRAIVKPSDYFNLDFPSADTHHCYQISDLHNDHILYGYTLISSDIDLQIKKVLLSAPQINAVLRVRYPTTSTNDRQLEITEVLEKGWVFREDDLPDPPLKVPSLTSPSPPATAPASPLSSEY